MMMDSPVFDDTVGVLGNKNDRRILALRNAKKANCGLLGATFKAMVE
jgi:hypothetical protein